MVKTCPHCGSQVNDAVRFCNVCGSPLLPPLQYQRARWTPPRRSPAPTGSIAKTLIAAILIVIAFVSGFALNYFIFPVPQSTTATTTIRLTETQQMTIQKTVTQIVSPTTTTTGAWQVVAIYSGTVNRTTAHFHIPSSTWRIKWSYGTSEHAEFGFLVYPAGETVTHIESVSSSTSSGSSETYIYQEPGDFYLKITVANAQYSITIEAQS